MRWGCTADAKDKIEIEGNPVPRCPKRLWLEDGEGLSEVLWLYSNYKRGQLPGAGGLQDQPAQLMTYFRIIDAAAAQIERLQEEKAERERNRNRNPGRGGARLVPKGRGR